MVNKQLLGPLGMCHNPWISGPRVKIPGNHVVAECSRRLGFLVVGASEMVYVTSSLWFMLSLQNDSETYVTGVGVERAERGEGEPA